MAKRQQPEADSSTKRVNFDNTRVDKFEKDIAKDAGNSPKPSGSKKKKRYRKPRGSAQGGNGSPDRKDVGSASSIFMRDPALLEAVTRLSNNYIAGMSFPTVNAPFTSAGVMVLLYSMTPVNNANYAVLKQAMNDQYSFVVHANSRNYNYSPEAQFTMEVAGCEIFAAIAMGLRVYGLMREYSATSTYNPQALISACGFKFNDLQRNYAMMYDDVCQLIAAAHQIWIPKSISFAKQWWDLNTAVYIDSESVDDQFYIYVPERFHRLQVDLSTGTYMLVVEKVWANSRPGRYASADNDIIVSKVTADNGWTWQEYLDMVRNMITAIARLQDRGMIYGDLLNAYGPENIFGIDYPAKEFVTPVIYDRIALHRIMNTTLSPFVPYNIGVGTSTQDATQVLYQVWGSFSASNGTPTDIWIQDPILNTMSDFERTPANLASVTRNMALGVSPGTSIQVPSFLPTNASMVCYDLQPYSNVTGRINVTNLPTDVHGPSTTTGPYVGPYAHGTETVVGIQIFAKAASGNNSRLYELEMWKFSATAGCYYMDFENRASIVNVSGNTYTIDILNGSYPFGGRVAAARAFSALLSEFDWRPIQYQFFTSYKLQTVTNGATVPQAESIICMPSINSGAIASVNGKVPGFQATSIKFEAQQILFMDIANVNAIQRVCLQALSGTPISMTVSSKSSKSIK